MAGSNSGGKFNVDDLIAGMQAQNQIRAGISQGLGQPSPITNQVLNFTAPGTFSGTPSIAPAPSEGIGSRIMDLLQRPLYGASDYLKYAFTGQNPLVGLGRGLAGKDKTTYIDTLQSLLPGLPKPLDVGLGTVANFTGDPSNAIGGGIGEGLKLLGIGQKGAKALELANKAQDIADADRAAALAAAKKGPGGPPPNVPQGPPGTYPPAPPTPGMAATANPFLDPLTISRLTNDPNAWPTPPAASSFVSQPVGVPQGPPGSFTGSLPMSPDLTALFHPEASGWPVPSSPNVTDQWARNYATLNAHTGGVPPVEVPTPKIVPQTAFGDPGLSYASNVNPGFAPPAPIVDEAGITHIPGGAPPVDEFSTPMEGLNRQNDPWHMLNEEPTLHDLYPDLTPPPVTPKDIAPGPKDIATHVTDTIQALKDSADAKKAYEAGWRHAGRGGLLEAGGTQPKYSADPMFRAGWSDAHSGSKKWTQFKGPEIPSATVTPAVTPTEAVPKSTFTGLPLQKGDYVEIEIPTARGTRDAKGRLVIDPTTGETALKDNRGRLVPVVYGESGFLKGGINLVDHNPTQAHINEGIKPAVPAEAAPTIPPAERNVEDAINVKAAQDKLRALDGMSRQPAPGAYAKAQRELMAAQKNPIFETPTAEAAAPTTPAIEIPNLEDFAQRKLGKPAKPGDAVFIPTGADKPHLQYRVETLDSGKVIDPGQPIDFLTARKRVNRNRSATTRRTQYGSSRSFRIVPDDPAAYADAQKTFERYQENKSAASQAARQVRQLNWEGRGSKPAGKPAPVFQPDQRLIDELTRNAQDLQDILRTTLRPGDLVGNQLVNSGHLDNINRYSDELIKGDMPRLDEGVQQDRAIKTVTSVKNENPELKGYKGQIQGVEQADAIRLHAEPAIRAQEFLDSKGGKLHYINAGDGAGAGNWNMSFGQVLSVLGNETKDRAWIDYPSFITPRHIQRMAAKALDWSGIYPGDPEGLRDALIHYGSDQTLNPMPNIASRTEAAHLDSVTRVATDLSNNIDHLIGIAVDNMARTHGMKIEMGLQEAAKINDNIVNTLKDGTLGDAVHTLADPAKDVRSIKDPEVRLVAGTKVAETVAHVSNPNDLSTARTVKGNVEDIKSAPSEAAATKKTNSRKAKQAKKDAEEARQNLASNPSSVSTEKAVPAPGGPPGPPGKVPPGSPPPPTSGNVPSNPAPNDPDLLNAAEIDNTISRLANLFSMKGAGAIGGKFRDVNVGSLSRMKAFSEGIFKATKGMTEDDLQIALTHHKMLPTKDLTTGQLVYSMPGEPGALAAYHALTPFIDTNFDRGLDPLMGSLFRGGATVKDINKVMKDVNLKFQFTTAAKGKGKVAFPKDQIAQQWRAAENPEDVKDWLIRVNGAAERLHTRQGLGAHFSYAFGADSGGVRDGIKYVKLPDNLKSETQIYQYVDKEKYYPQPLVDNLVALERILKQSTSFDGAGLFAKTMRNVLDPTMAIWKTSATIIRPGHHTRNAFGDFLLNMMQGMYSIKDYQDAFKIMHAHGVLNKEAFAQMYPKMAESPEQAKLALMNANDYRVTVKGRVGAPQTYDAAGMGRIIFQHGLMPKFTTSEDILQSTTNTGLQKVADRFIGSKPIQLAGKVAENNSNYFRAAQFLNTVRKPEFMRQYQTVEDGFAAAAQKVRATHPDSTGLAPFEQKYMRRLVPFYSWIRQAAPVVFSTMLTKPGRVTGLSKVELAVNDMFNQQGNNGPADLYPNSLMVPSYIRSTMSYVGGNYNFNLGSPTEALFGDVLGGPPKQVEQNLLGMTTPFIKIPLELSSGVSLSTGAKIPDKSQYISNQIPFASNFAAISGYDPVGTIANFATGKFTPETERAVAAGDKQHLWNTSLWNFFTGLGMQQIGTPNQAASAYREMGRTGG